MVFFLKIRKLQLCVITCFFILYCIVIYNYNFSDPVFEQIHKSDGYCDNDSEYCEREFVAFMKYKTTAGLDVDSWYESRNHVIGTHYMTPLINANMMMPRGYNYTCRLLLNDLRLDLNHEPGSHLHSNCWNGNWDKPFEKYIVNLNRYTKTIKMGDQCDYQCRRCVSMSSLLHKTRIASVSLDNENNIKSCTAANIKISEHRHIHDQNSRDRNLRFSFILVGMAVFVMINELIGAGLKRYRNKKHTQKIY